MSNDIIPTDQIEEYVDFSKGSMHKSLEMGSCKDCGSRRTIMISGVIGKFLIAQHKCPVCRFSMTFRKELESFDYPQRWGEEQREFESHFWKYQVWPPVAPLIENKHENALQNNVERIGRENQKKSRY